MIGALRARWERVTTLVRVGVRSKVVYNLTSQGTVAAIKSLSRKTSNPSDIYRIWGANSPTKRALVCRGRTLTFGELDKRIDELAAGLRTLGVARGKSVVLLTRNSVEFVEVQLACTRLSASCVSVSWRSTARELRYFLEHSGAMAIVFEEEFEGVVREAIAEDFPALSRIRIPSNLSSASSDAITSAVSSGEAGTLSYPTLFHDASTFVTDDGEGAVVVYTSGTTGKPKGAVRKFSRNSLIAALQLLSTTPMAHDDIHLVVCPMYHTTAYGFLGLTHLLGGTAVIAEDFRPETFLAQVEEHQVTTVAMVPTMLHRLMRHPDPAMREKLRSLRTIVTTGSPLTAALAKEVSETLGPIVYNIYGSTETGAVTLATPSDLAEAPGTIGRAVPGCEIRLLKEDGSLAKAGEIGELYAKNHLVVTGYHNDSSATNACVREGFFSVGDLATFDREGRYFIAGRKHDMIISGGVNVYPVEIEAVLEQHPSILEAAIVGVDHPEWGESVRAFVVMRSDHVFDQEALRIFAREHLSGPKMPREFIVLETLPRNPTGKILKRELRAHMSGP